MTTERPKNALAKIPRRAAPQRRSRGGASRAARSQAEPGNEFWAKSVKVATDFAPSNRG
jgi:hypothetical protein